MPTIKTMLAVKENGVMMALCFLVCIFTLLSDTFLSVSTFASVCTVSAEIGLLALGATLLMIVGEFDLSMGSTFATAGMVFALLTTSFELNAWLALGAALLCGALIGLLNGLVTLRTGIPSFITTLGTMLFFRGLVLIITDGFPIAALSSNSVMEIMAHDLGHDFRSSIFIWLLAGGLLFYYLNLHPWGNIVMATGGNRDAAYAMGVKVAEVKISCFMLAGILSALAGVIQFAHLMSTSPTAGEQFELKAIAIAVIGGTALNGGSGTMFGTILATLIMGVLASGLVQAGVSTYWFRALVGMILVLAVIMNTTFKRLSERSI